MANKTTEHKTGNNITATVLTIYLFAVKSAVNLFDNLLMVASRSAVANAAGYRVSSTHANPLGIKTDAPWNVIWDLIRCWIQDHPVKGHEPDSYGKRVCKDVSSMS